MIELESKDKVETFYNKHKNTAIIAFSADKGVDFAVENRIVLSYNELAEHIRNCKYVLSLFPQYQEDIMK